MAARLLAYALELPDAWEDHPWGDTVVKVNKKIFTFIGSGADPQYPPSLTVKLADSHEQAMQVERAEATGYGLGRAGWVTLKLATAPTGRRARGLDRGELPPRGAEAAGRRPRRANLTARRVRDVWQSGAVRS